MGSWTPDLELQLAEACFKRAPLGRRRELREYVARLRAEKSVRRLAEQADVEARGRPGWRADIDG